MGCAASTSRIRNINMPPIIVKNWDKGLITRVEKESVGRGAASDSLNWHFFGDRIELRRGQTILGTAVEGSGNATFVKVGRKYNGDEVIFWGYGRKFLYYDTTTEDNIEISTDVLPTSASGEDVSPTLYQSLAGSFIYLSSPNSSVYKIAVANPGSITDMLQDVYRGYIKATQGRMFLWNRKDKYGGGDKTGVYLSAIDKDSLADYSFTSAEDVGTGDGADDTFSGTLAFKASNSKATCHYVRIASATSALVSITAITQAASGVVTASGHGLAVGDVVVFQGIVGMTQLNKRIAVVTAVNGTAFTIDINTTGFTAYSSGGSVGKAELFTDNRSGGLVGSQGGTGTINYTSGAWSVDFNTAPVNTAEIVADYYTEDSTSTGVLDFNEGSGSAIGDSFNFRQDDVGFMQNVGIIGDNNYCLHSKGTYALRLISSTDITNLVFRERMGIPNWRASVSTGDGIYFVDASDPKDPTIRVLETNIVATKDIPRSISDNLDLSLYSFDACVMFEWGEYIMVACRLKTSTVNNRLLMFNRTWKTWEIHDFRISDMDSNEGTLVGGDSGSLNLVKFFTGLTDDNAIIPNFFITENDELDKEGVKDLRRAKVAGLIGIDQRLDISYSLDNEPFVFVKSILGSGSYVDSSQRKLIGTTTLGEAPIGGGATVGEGIFASPYELEFFVGTKRFHRIRWKFEAKAIGYLSISEYGFVDYRDKGKRLPTKYVE